MENLKSIITSEGTDNKEIAVNQLEFIKPKTVGQSSGYRSDAGVCTVVNSKKNGKRVTFSKDVMERLGNPESIELSFTEDGVAIAEKIPENGVSFGIRKSGHKGVIYSAGLVEEITEVFNLNFEDRVSITFTESKEYGSGADGTIINIIMK